MPKGIKGFQKGHKRFAGVLFGQGQIPHHKKGKEHPLWKEDKLSRKEYSRQWLIKNRDKARLITIRRRARIRSVGGSFTVGEWEALKKQYGYKCPCCKQEKPLTVDHIIPLSKGGSNYIENIQPLCGLCNSRKHTKVIRFEY